MRDRAGGPRGRHISVTVSDTGTDPAARKNCLHTGRLWIIRDGLVRVSDTGDGLFRTRGGGRG
jgi:hypothetical protein